MHAVRARAKYPFCFFNDPFCSPLWTTSGRRTSGTSDCGNHNPVNFAPPPPPPARLWQPSRGRESVALAMATSFWVPVPPTGRAEAQFEEACRNPIMTVGPLCHACSTQACTPDGFQPVGRKMLPVRCWLQQAAQGAPCGCELPPRGWLDLLLVDHAPGSATPGSSWHLFLLLLLLTVDG